MELAERALRAVFIDLDGTVLHTIPTLYDCYLKFLQGYGEIGSPEEFDRLNGPTLPEVILYLKERYGIRENSESLLALYQENVLDKINEFSVLPGCEECLWHLREQGVNLFIVTSSPKNFAQKALEAHGLYALFTSVICGDEIEKGKPDPMIYQEALYRAQVAPQQALAIEDSFRGVQSARAAGVPTLFLSSENQNLGLDPVLNVKSWKEVQLFLFGS